MKNKINCILCSSEAKPFFETKTRDYYQCKNCSSILMDPDDYISAGEEKERYLKHNNDVNDPGYQRFVSPIVNEVLRRQSAYDSGLDYGAGTGPVIAKLLEDNGYQIETYDPFFNGNKEALRKTYDYIVCCEVVEHFHNPVEEFEGLKNILKKGGILYCMTQLYDSTINFKTWNYKDDETHFIIYHKDAMEWIRKRFGFSSLEINNRLILLSD